MWFKVQGDYLIIQVFAKPNAKQTVILKADDQGLHIALHAKPKEGEANKVLIDFLAKFFKIPKSQVELLRGESSRYKQIKIPLTKIVSAFLNDPNKLIKQ